MSNKLPYRAVDVTSLRHLLGRNCSPDGNYAAYVVGPNIHNQLCHVASCRSMEQAKAIAATLNEEYQS